MWQTTADEAKALLQAATLAMEKQAWLSANRCLKQGLEISGGTVATRSEYEIQLREAAQEERQGALQIAAEMRQKLLSECLQARDNALQER